MFLYTCNKPSETENVYIFENTIYNSMKKYEIFQSKSDKICARICILYTESCYSKQFFLKKIKGDLNKRGESPCP